MKFQFHKNFKKALQKQPRKIQIKFKEKFKIFENDKFHHSLNNHALIGKFKGIRSINITGDVRVHYEEINDVVIFINIDNHSELY